MTIILDFINVDTKKKLFSLFNENFCFNEECNNLDALYDELTSISDEYEIIIKNIDVCFNVLGNYINVLKTVLNDVEKECENIHIVYE